MRPTFVSKRILSAISFATFTKVILLTPFLVHKKCLILARFVAGQEFVLFEICVSPCFTSQSIVLKQVYVLLYIHELHVLIESQSIHCYTYAYNMQSMNEMNLFFSSGSLFLCLFLQPLK